MRIALISPYSIGPLRGNIITVNRISQFLLSSGLELLVLPADALSVKEMEQRLVSFSPDLIHGFHAFYCGEMARHLATCFSIPYVITITGSDLHDPSLRNRPDTLRAIEAARAIVCFNDNEAAELTGYFPNVSNRIVVISQGVERLPVTSEDSFDFVEDAFVLLLPAALRPVKQIEFPVLALASLVQRFPTIKLVVAGGVIDQNYAATISVLLSKTPYAEWLGEISRELMGSLYTRADVVLNCSNFESMPNTLLEAMALGRPVLAVDIPGNRALIHHGSTGLLYHDKDSFLANVTKLIEDNRLRTVMGEHAREFIREGFSPQNEAEKHIHLYKELIVQSN